MVSKENSFRLPGIYMIMITYDNKLLYVGKYLGARIARLRNHLSCLKKGAHANKHMQAIYNKHGAGVFMFALGPDMPNATPQQIQDVEDSLIPICGTLNMQKSSDFGDYTRDTQSKPITLEHVDGRIVTKGSMSEFARDVLGDYTSGGVARLCEIYYGIKHICKGWFMVGKREEAMRRAVKYSIKTHTAYDPQNNKHTIRHGGLREHCRKFGLGQGHFVAMLRGKCPHHQNWTKEPKPTNVP
jgi:hypothetical protein